MDDVRGAWYQMAFERDFHKKRGEEFQVFFWDLMSKAYPEDFERVRPYGRLGDLKCDGYLRSGGIVFQVYAPWEIDLKALLKKIREDFEGAAEHWSGRMRAWIFVHNDDRGLPGPAVQLLLDLERDGVKTLTWSREELRRVVPMLSEEALVAQFGLAPSRRDFDSLGFDKLRVVLGVIGRAQPPDGIDIGPVPVGKLAANALSSSVGLLLQTGRQRERLVEDFLDKWHDPTLGDEIAAAFRMQYADLRARNLSPDRIFAELQEFAGGTAFLEPDYQAAVLAVLAYLFDRCDIFEGPPLASAHDSAD